VAAEYVERRGASWGASHRCHVVRFLENDAYPDLGDLPIAGIGPAHVVAVLQKVEARAPTAARSSTIGAVFVRAGYGGQFSPHGFRSTTSTMLREAGFDSALIELQLAHLDRNKSRASYDHAELLEPRRAMMQSWADMIGGEFPKQVL